MRKTRRTFLKDSSKWAMAASASAYLPFLLNTSYSANAKNHEVLLASNVAMADADDLFFKISLAEWSVREKLRSGDITNLDFPSYTKKTFGVDAVEYVNQFFRDKAKDQSYLNELKKRADDEGVTNVLIMIDNEGPLASSSEYEREKAVENHYKWIEAAKTLGCHTVRVNTFGQGSYRSTLGKATESLRKLSEFADPMEINVVVENHGGFTSNAFWLTEVMQKVDHPRCGTLPDFGNFTVDAEQGVVFDYLLGVKMLMPYAKGVSAKTQDFDENGNETLYDFKRLLSIIKTAGYTGHIGIEWGGGGSRLSAEEGIKATRDLLIKVGKEFS